MKRACAATVAAATAVALAAGMADPAPANGERTVAASATEASALKTKHRITLITGDRVAVSVYVSYDHGRTWKKTTVTKGKITVKNPAKGKAVSFRARIADKKGDTSTICNAYHGT